MLQLITTYKFRASLMTRINFILIAYLLCFSNIAFSKINTNITYNNLISTSSYYNPVDTDTPWVDYAGMNQYSSLPSSNKNPSATYLNDNYLMYSALKIAKINEDSFLVGGIINTNSSSEYNLASKNNIGTDITINTLTTINTWLIVTAGARINSKFNLNNTMLIIGNLNKYPIFIGAGISDLPIGFFGGNGLYASEIGRALFSSDAVNNITASFYADGLNTNISFFNADNGSGNFSYGLFYYGNFLSGLSYGVNFGYLFNIHGTNNALAGYLNQYNNNARIGLIHIEGVAQYKQYGVSGGWSSTTQDSLFNKKIGSWYIALGYNLDWLSQYWTISSSYSQSYNTQNIPVDISFNDSLKIVGVQKQFIISAQQNLFKNHFSYGPQYQYIKLYNGQHSNIFAANATIHL